MISADKLKEIADMAKEDPELIDVNHAVGHINFLLKENIILRNILEAADYLVNGPEMFGFNHKEILKELIKEWYEL